MSVIKTVEDFTSSIETAVGSGVTAIASNLESAVGTFAGQLSTALETQFRNLKSLINDGETDIDNNIKLISTNLGTVVSIGEGALESVFQECNQ